MIYVEQLKIAGNRGPCGGVNMAIDTTELVLDIVNGREPVYTNWDVVNNTPLMEDYTQRGLVNIRNNFDLVPDNAILIFSAHGIPPYFREIAAQKHLLAVDLTCQLVNRPHTLVKKAVLEGKTPIYIGANGHPEAMGVMGEVEPGKIFLVENLADIDALELPADSPKVVYSQTTLLPDEVIEIEEALEKKFPNIEIPDRLDICYAMYNRQTAVEKLIEDVDLLVVVGSQHSHNSKGLRKKGEKVNIPSYLVDTPAEIDLSWFNYNIRSVGLTSGASVLDRLLIPFIDWFKAQNQEVKITYQPQVIDERVMTFKRNPEAERAIEAIKARYTA